MKYHEGIFYPEDKTELDSLLGNVNEDKTASALILPHASLKTIASLVREGFSYTKNKEMVIIFTHTFSF